MLNKTDLSNAVSEGIITREQEIQLNAFSERTHANDENPLYQVSETRDEPFRLLRGFRDIFIALGIAFLAVGATVLYTSSHTSALFYFGPAFSDYDWYAGFWPAIASAAVLLAIGIAIAEIVTRKLRLPLSSLVLSLAIAYWAGLFGVQCLAPLASLLDQSKTPSFPIGIAGFFLSAFIGISLFYLRYRLPFVMLVVAGTLVGLGLSVISSLWPEFASQNLRFVIGGLGALVFVVAMNFDLKDRLRITRFSEIAFWLHLLAAPLMIHSFLRTHSLAQNDVPLILTVFAILTFIALVIDRRAVLVSSLVYMGGAFVQIVLALGLQGSMLFAVPILSIGVLVVVLGIGWTPLRRLVLSITPSAITDRVPPIAVVNTAGPKEIPAAAT